VLQAHYSTRSVEGIIRHLQQPFPQLSFGRPYLKTVATAKSPKTIFLNFKRNPDIYGMVRAWGGGV